MQALLLSLPPVEAQQAYLLIEPGRGWTQHELTKKDTPGF